MKFSISLFNKFLGGLFATLIWKEARPFVKDIYIVLTTERRSDLVEYHVHLQAIWEKFKNFDYAEADLMAINADEDDHLL